MKKQFAQASEDGMVTIPTKNAKKFPYSVGDLDKHANVSMYYGFTPVKIPEVSREDLARAKTIAPRNESLPKNEPNFAPEERIALLRSYLENEMHSFSQPIMVCYKKRKEGKRNPREVRVGLDIFGTARAIGEALVIQAAMAILHDEGYKEVTVELNSIGDKDAMAKHDKELNLYLRKHAHTISPKFKVQLKACPQTLLSMTDEEIQALRDNAPKSVSCLPESGRRHLMELLEFLETLEVPYRLNHSLLGHRGVSNHVIFQIKHAADDARPALAYGFRYNALSQKVGFRKELPAVGVNLSFEKISHSKTDSSWKPMTSPKFYFIQFGGTARLKSLKLIEMLRREGIPVYHSLTKDKLVGQIATAESLKVPYLLIMGQKEALEESIVVRDLNTRAQETVYLRDLVSYLKKLK